MIRLLLLATLLAGSAAAAETAGGWWEHLRGIISQNLGRPYVWGATGFKSYDCSGFVWRVYHDAGAPFKRTTARKLYFMLSPVAKGSEWNSGNVVFFDDLKHCGIVNTNGDFYHAASSAGTGLSKFDPYWRPKICGVRRVARLE